MLSAITPAPSTATITAASLQKGQVYAYPGQSTFRRIITKPRLTKANNAEFRVQDLTSGHTYSVSLDSRFRVELVA